MKLIGISGGAGSGKSTLAKELKKELLSQSITASIIHLDSYYYKDGVQGHYIIGKRNGKRFLDMNHPDSIDITTVQKSIDTIDTDLTILEGLFPICIQSLAEQLDTSIYIDVPADIRLGRKIIRKLEEKNTAPQVVFENYLDTVRDRHFKFIEPFKDKADLITDGTLNTKEQVTQCLAAIKNRSSDFPNSRF